MSSKIKPKALYPPGDFGIWLIVYMELITFGLLFIGYVFSRRAEVELFNSSQLLLDQKLGFINTLLLLTSSYFIVKALKAIELIDREKAIRLASRSIEIAMMLGSLFILIKIVEFSDKYAQGISLSTNTFFMFYLLLTAFHFLHVLLGLVILFNIRKNIKASKYTKENHQGMLSGGVYWHLVDLLWIVLFPLIYIMR